MTDAASGPDLGGRRFLVTGAAGGIGGAVVEQVCRQGGRAVACDLDAAGLEALERRLAADGLELTSAVADVADPAACARAVASAEEQLGGLDVLVNNAGIGAFGLTLDATTDEQWDRVIAVNLSGVFRMSRSALPALRRAGRGAIVNVSSVHAVATSGGLVPYAAAKGGVLAMTRAMAIDLAADGIRVVAILPGATETAMFRESLEREGRTAEEAGFSMDRTVLGRVADPAEVAAAIVFAGSTQASAITGSAITVDTGLLAGF